MRRKILWAIFALFAITLWWSALMTVMPMSGTGTMIIIVPKGASATEIGRMLSDREVIRSTWGFNLVARITGKSTSLKPGAYRLSPSMKPREIIDKISAGDVDARWVTFPEGFTVPQIAERLDAEGLADADRFRQLAQTGGLNFEVDFPRPVNLEGYLFPDTYLMPLAAPEEQLILEMIETFEKKVVLGLEEDLAKSHLTLHEVITLASMIEREAKVAGDRPLISAVMHNRLRKNMRLEIDATVLFALGKHKNRVLFRDLEINSPYNTYRYAGLPPGPIASPGIECITAALNPANVDYLYYVARPNGSHIFSLTMEEHQHAIRIARREAN